MLLSQGAEISRANIHVSELYAQLEKLVNDTASLSSVESELDVDDKKISLNGEEAADANVKPVENGVRDPIQ